MTYSKYLNMHNHIHLPVDVVTNSYVVGGSVHVIYGRTLGNSDYPNLDVGVG